MQRANAFCLPVRHWVVRFSSLSRNTRALIKEVNVRVFSSTIRAENMHAVFKTSLEVAHEMFKLLARFVLCLGQKIRQ
jgi:hypothetical protein